MRPIVRRSVAIAGMLLASAAAGGAQDVPNVTGHVRSPAGVPIAGVEVGLLGSDMATRTDNTGAFAMVKVPEGPQTLTFRRIGYLPTVVPVAVPGTSGKVEVTLVPAPPTLDTVTVTANLKVLAGIVVDSANRPIPDATIDVLGTYFGSATTDENGWFKFTSVRAGTVVLQARKLGYAPVLQSVRLDDWRGVVVHMDLLDSRLSAAKRLQQSGFGNTDLYTWSETVQRLKQRGLRSAIVPQEELKLYEDLPLGQAIERTRSGAMASMDLQAAGSNVCILEDGRRPVGSASLDIYRTEDVEYVELYPPGTEESGTVWRYMRGAGCRRVSVPGGYGVFYAVVWLKS